MAASAISLATFICIETWKTGIIDLALDVADNLYKTSINLRADPAVEGGPNDQYYLEVNELYSEVYIFPTFGCSFTVKDTFYGKYFNSQDAELMSLEERLQIIVGKNINAILTMNGLSVAIISYNGLYYLFDSHSRNESGTVSNEEGQACVSCFDHLEQLFIMIITNMFICEENANTQRNVYLLATIEITNCRSNDQTYDVKGIPTNTLSEILMSYLSNLDENVTDNSSNSASTSNQPRDPTVNTSQNSIPNKPTKNTSANSGPNDSNIKRPSSKLDTYEPSKPKKKKKRQNRPRSSFVSNVHKKLIVDVEHLTEQLNQSFYEHRLASYDDECRQLNCCLNYIGPIMNGLQCSILYECSACEFEFMVFSERESNDIARTNDSIVLGCISSGIGFYQLEGLLTAADLPCHNYRSYSVAETVVGCYVTKTAVQSMNEAAKESDQRARNEGRVTEENISFTTVITDGTYQKRSYASGLYNSSSGAALVVDQHINKILDVGVANKRCSQCQFGKQPYHLCWQNFSANQSSTRMESSIILELFQSSVEKYNIIYKYIISDGDSSVPQGLSDHNVYGKYNVEVQKINCVNHMLRRLSTNLKKVKKSSHLKGEKNLQNAIEQAGRLSSKAIRAAARHIMSSKTVHNTKVKIMQEDLDNIPYHVFGRHENCKNYYCDKQPETNYTLTLITLNVWNTILGYYARCQAVPGDILLNSSNNAAECANNIIATKIGGKRIDFCNLGGYTIRVAFAVVQYNSKTAMCDTFAIWKKCVPERLLTLEKKRKEKVEYNNRRYAEKGSQGRYLKKGNGTEDCYYGPKAGIAITPEEYQKLLHNHREKLQQLQNDRVKLERETIEQAQSEKWHTVRRLLLTASNFKNASKCRIDKTRKNTVTGRFALDR